MSQLDYTAEQILSIDKRSDLFGSDESNVVKMYRRLLKKWHPDMNTNDTSDVFVHITSLFNSGDVNSSYMTETIDGTEITYLYKIVKDIYTLYYTGASNVLIKFHPTIESRISSNYVRNLNALKVNISPMKFADRYADLFACKLNKSASNLLLIKIPSDYVPLSLLLNYIEDFKEWKISAYIISRLYDQAMMYNMSDLSMVGGDPDFIFVDTKTHKIIDLSALFFSIEKNNKLLAASPHIGKCIVKNDLNTKTCSHVSVNNMIINTALLLAGDRNRTGNINLVNKDDACIDLIKQISTLDRNKEIYDLYKMWQDETIKTVFKERSFYKNEISINDLVKYI